MKFRLTRRRFLYGAGAVSLGVGTYTWRIEPHWLTVVQHEMPIHGLPAGAFDLGDGRSLYINRGMGHLIRVRFNVRPEITLFRLV
jgi:predicted MPP superfamily phosphohydrolase